MTRTNQRALANWPDNAISVLDYGAVGDGVTDDTAAIQEAVDSLGTDGGEVYFPTGNYAFKSITLKPRVKVKGNWSSVFPIDNPDQCFLIPSTGAFRSWADIEVSGFYLEGDVTNFVYVTGNSWSKLCIQDIENISGSGYAIVKTGHTSGQNPTGFTLYNIYSKVGNGFQYIWHSAGGDTNASIDTAKVEKLFLWPTAGGYTVFVNHLLFI